MNRYRTLLRNYFFEILGFLIIGIFLCFFANSSGGKHITQQFFDGIRTTSNRNDVVIIGIDDKSLQALGAWPWDRKVFAELTKKLDAKQAKSIVYDILFLEERAGDKEFSEVLKNIQSNVVLASKTDDGVYLPSFFINATNTRVVSGFSNVNPDVDGKVRVYPLFKNEASECVHGLGVEAYLFATFKRGKTCLDTQGTYFRYPHTVQMYSVIDVLENKVQDESIRNKTVFIGSDSLDLEDHFVGMSGEKIPGVQVHASIFSSLMNKEGDRELSSIEISILLILSMLFTLLVLHYTKTVVLQIISIAVMMLLVYIASYISFGNHVITPLPWLLLAVFVSSVFSILIRFIRERKKSEHVQSLFSKYVHKDVLRELMKSPGKLNLTGEKRYLTVLFSDLRGFTTLSESMSPEALTSVLNGYFSAMTPIILDERGTVDKFIGDAVMAFWNAPLPVDHHEGHAVRAAIRMQEEITRFNGEHGYTLAAGVGIHAGDAVVGNVGSQERVNYTILGDTVNLASRVEGLTKKYGVGVLVTDEVRNKIEDDTIMFRKLDVITVKGKTKPTVLYEARRVSDLFEDISIDYEIAFASYQKGDFDEASVLFKALANRGDIPSQIMYERIMLIEKTGTWDGVWHWDEK